MAQVVELFIYSKKMKTKDGRSFISRSTKYNFLDGENGQRKVHYAKVLFCGEKCFEGSNLKEKDITRGILTVDASQVNIPDKWEVTKDENGKDVYPVCKIFGGIAKFEERKKEHEFHFDTTDVVNEEPEEPQEILEDPEEN